MEREPSASDRDARLLGLALLHGYVEAEQLQRAAKEDPSPSRILAALQRSGILDEPCLEGLERALRDFSSPDPRATGSTQMEPPRHLGGATSPDPPSAAPPWDEGAERSDSGAALLRSFTVPRWKHYRNLRFVGEGGMGRIYKATDPDLKRTVALKFLRDRDPSQLKRFLFEAQAQALLDHPNICRVYEVSAWQGQHYIAMQYVNGATLLRAAARLEVPEKLRIAEAVARAIHAAHRRGLIHRDLKPANVLLEQGEDGQWKPYVVDFGLARELEAPGMTVSGLVLGTKAYMAPEQARGESHHVDRRTDVYGLGATFYQLFSGSPPYGQASGMDCLRLVLDEDPLPLWTRTPGLPKDVETVVMKCLEKDPSRRYDDARALAEDLRRVREGEPIQARPASWGYRLRRFAQRNRPLVVAVAVVLAGLLVSAGVAARARLSAAARERYAQRFGQEAERIGHLVRYARLLPQQDIEPYLQSARQRVQRLEAEVQASGRAAEGPGAYAIGRALLAVGEDDRALELLERAEALGFQSNDLAYAQGLVYGHRYQRERDRAQRLDTPELRAARLQEVEAQWGERARAHLQAARGQTTEPQDYLEALLDAYGGRSEAALAKTRAAAAALPWYYEAKSLEGELLLALAKESADPGQARGRLEEASRCFAAARAIAGSDAALWLGEAKVQRERLAHPVQKGDGGLHLAECRKAVEACLRIKPSDKSPLVQVSWGLFNLAKQPENGRRESESLLEEGMKVVDQLLAENPEDYEALVSRMIILDSRGRNKRAVGTDATEFFQGAVQAARIGIEKFPGDALILHHAISVAQSMFTYQSSQGKDSYAIRQQALEWVKETIRRFPESKESHIRKAAFLIELADWERLHGHDPTGSVNEALGSLMEAKRLGIEPARLLFSEGNAYLIRGQYLLAMGRGGILELDQAVRIKKERLKFPSPTCNDFGDYAESLIYRGIAECQEGRNPNSWLTLADEAILGGLGIQGYYWLYQLRGQCEWVRGKWELAQKRSPKVFFQKAEVDLRRACSVGKTADCYRWLARLELDRAGSLETASNGFGIGLQAANWAIQKDPSSGESYLILAQLKEAERRRRRDANGKGDFEALLQKAISLNGNLRHEIGILTAKKG